MQEFSRTRLSVIIALLAFLPTTTLTSAKDKKPLEWKTGTLLDIHEEQGVRHVPVNSTMVEKHHDQTYYTIDGEKYIYVARRSMTSRGDRAVPLTIKGSVKFAIDDQDLLLIDEKRKEHQFAIEKKALRDK